MKDNEKEKFENGRIFDKINKLAESIRDFQISTIAESLNLENSAFLESKKSIDKDDFYLNLAVKYTLSVLKAKYDKNELL